MRSYTLYFPFEIIEYKGIDRKVLTAETIALVVVELIEGKEERVDTWAIDEVVEGVETLKRVYKDRREVVVGMKVFTQGVEVDLKGGKP